MTPDQRKYELLFVFEFGMIGRCESTLRAGEASLQQPLQHAVVAGGAAVAGGGNRFGAVLAAAGARRPVVERTSHLDRQQPSSLPAGAWTTELLSAAMPLVAGRVGDGGEGEAEICAVHVTRSHRCMVLDAGRRLELNACSIF
ncbi:hypothetical protein C0Q70_05238 [Pomacea canaliculata]|uniref:Uncharacterized protein n=1 Tax=Pomacea canaliculata TaxID=400727 RepID=A0A2T7PKL1_POMCA|nr:hypothetical protein C0Q70_05238 [Pomacea canaliculata]